MADRIQNRRDTAARWAQFNPVLLEGETGYVTDNPNQYKIGDGVHTWNELPLRGYNGTIVESFGNSSDEVMSQNFITKLINRYLSSAHGTNAIVKKGNLLNGISFTNGKYLNIADGSVISMQTYSYSDYIDIEGIVTLMFSFIPSNGVCFYDINKEFISGYGSGSLNNYYNVIVEVPVGTKYMRVNASIESINDGTAYVIDASPLSRGGEFTIKYPWLITEDKRFEEIPLKSRSVKYQNGILRNNVVTSGFPSFNTYIFDVSDYAGEDISISATGLADPNNGWDLYVLVFEDSTTQIVANTVGKELSDYKVSLPANTKYLKMSSYKNIFISAKDGDSILFPELYTAQDVKNEMLLNISKLPLTGKTANIFDDDINLIRDVTFIEGKYLKYDDGEELVFPGYSYTDYIDVSGISKLQISSVPENGGCFYDENKNFLSGFARKGNTTEYNAIVEVPEKAKYIRLNFSMQSRSSRTAYMIDYTKSPSAVEYPWLKMLVTTILNPVATASGYMTENGTINTSVPSGGTITKYDVSGINSVFISISTNLSLGANPKWCTIWVVDSDNTPILMLPVDTTGNTFSNYNLVIPKLGTQLWVQSEKPEVAIKSNINEVLTNIQQTLQTIQSSTNQWIGKKIVWLGTSIPYGQGTDGVGNALNTYPMQVGAKLGAHVVNVAQPGMAIETTDDFKRKSYGSLSLSIGELQSEGAATTPYQSYENAMLGQGADLYVFDCEPNNSNFDLTDLENFSVQKWAYNDSSTFESHRNSYVGALLFLLDKLWTEQPSAKVVFISEYIKGANLDEKYKGINASKAVADKLRIPLIDVASKLYYTPKNKSLYLNSDNVHPTQVAHNRIANILVQELLNIN